MVQQELMGSLHETFISFVKERRGSALINPEKQDIFSGRVWTGTDAVKVGLVDNVGTLSEVRMPKPQNARGYILETQCCGSCCEQLRTEP